MYTQGERIKIKSSEKEELVSHYETSSGMSGMSRKDVNNIYIYKGMDGSNIMAENELDNSVKISLNHLRFEKCEDIKTKKYMNKKERKDIFRAAKKLISSEVKDIDKLKQGAKESIQNNYIEKVCIENGFTLSDFYATNSKELLDLF